MKIVETQNEGLKRAYTLTIPAAEIDARVDEEIRRMAPKVKMPGFRPGKVPPNLIRKMHGPALQQEALNGAVQDSVQKLMAEKKLRPAMQPAVELDADYVAGGDAKVKVSLETLPDIPEPRIDGLSLERLTVAADESAVDEQIASLAAGQKNWLDAPEGHAAASGDLVVLDYSGTVGGEAFEGGTGEDMSVEIGSGSLIPGFEDQLVGITLGEERRLEVRFPEDYPAPNLKGKDAVFEVRAKAIKTAGDTKIDDEFAKALGLTGLDQLRELVRGQQVQELAGLTRTHMKRRLLDQLAEAHDFPVPASMVEAEYDSIIRQLRHEASHEQDPEAANREIDEEANEYRSIAERRVRLGLLLSQVGHDNGIEVSPAEMNRLIGQAAQQYSPKDRERFVQYIQQDPMAAAQLRAPLYEDKVVDFLFGKAAISERSVSRAELEADLESEVGHVHGPGCGHDHDHDHDAKPAAEAAKKKAQPATATKSRGAAKSAVAETETAAKPAKGAVEPRDADNAPAKPARPVKEGAGAKAPTARAVAKKASK